MAPKTTNDYVKGDRVEVRASWDHHPYGGTIQRGTVVVIHSDRPFRDHFGNMMATPGYLWVRYDANPHRDFRCELETVRKLNLLELIAEAAE